MIHRLWRFLIALIAWAGVLLQYALMVEGQPASAIPGLTLNFFSFFTILSNILAAGVLTALVLRPGAVGPALRAGVVLYIAVVGLTYHLLLAQVWDPQGLQRIVDQTLHTVTPVAYILDWLIVAPKGRLRSTDALRWLAFPGLYGAWTLIHGLWLGWWPYWFLDGTTIGWGPAALYFAGLLAAFLVGGLGLVALDRVIGRGDSRAQAA